MGDGLYIRRHRGFLQLEEKQTMESQEKKLEALAERIEEGLLSILRNATLDKYDRGFVEAMLEDVRGTLDPSQADGK